MIDSTRFPDAQSAKAQTNRPLQQQRAIVDFLRAMVVAKPDEGERFHAVFLDGEQTILGDAPLGQARAGSLSLRMREIFQLALSMDAEGMIVAHNHPSGQCRPSAFDITATRRLKDIARALDIELLDHLIITTSSVYSMRAGGDL
ncbi:JAB domain-containing protein [uncultured Erythrobacter sp.]|uniref:JAB domain-containing protein n=1 Tax=uncultured Erythrobacter sp. TaxID=263913 RepID=UPI00260AC884|nr:JAB domain-containing protein [uncultured Erythrobacter sp.]